MLEDIDAGKTCNSDHSEDSGGSGIADASQCLNALDAGQGWQPVGDNAIGFTGSFAGGRYKVFNLYINRPTTNHVGLFGYNEGVISDLGITAIQVTGNDYVGVFAERCAVLR